MGIKFLQMVYCFCHPFGVVGVVFGLVRSYIKTILQYNKVVGTEGGEAFP